MFLTGCLERPVVAGEARPPLSAADSSLCGCCGSEQCNDNLLRLHSSGLVVGGYAEFWRPANRCLTMSSSKECLYTHTLVLLEVSEPVILFPPRWPPSVSVLLSLQTETRIIQ